MAATPRPLTGRKVLAIAVSAFGVIIAANMALVYAAVGSFPGLEVRNTYVASQSFDADREAQDSLGWHAAVNWDGTTLSLILDGPDGRPADLQDLRVTVGRATTAADDRPLAFSAGKPPYSQAISLAPGKWEVRIAAVAADCTKFHRRLPVFVAR